MAQSLDPRTGSARSVGPQLAVKTYTLPGGKQIKARSATNAVQQAAHITGVKEWLSVDKSSLTVEPAAAYKGPALAAGDKPGTGGGGTIPATPALFDVTAIAADGDAAPPGNEGTLHVAFGSGQPTLAADATLTLTIDTTGIGAGSHPVTVQLTAGMHAQQAETAIVNAVNATAITGVTAANGTGTNVDFTAAAGTQIASASVAIT